MTRNLRLCLSAMILTLPVLSQDRVTETWKQFRTAYPYHIQATAITAPASDGTRVLIASEPPANITLRSFIDIDPILLRGADTRKQRMGYNGWLKDIVVTVPRMEDTALEELLDKIHDKFFGTTYKASTIALPANAFTATSGIPLDVQVTTADLNRWLISGKLTFRAFGDPTAVTVPELLRTKKEGAYLSVEPGMAVLVLPRSGDYMRFSREIRHFALDSDIVLGAIANATHVAILARERIVPTATMPPLRTETVLQLANVRGGSLEQSYQRRYILAGRYDEDTNLDWAPIYLSDTLIDTEYGSLLNLTDQFLKSWSEAGMIKYVNFSYPDPANFPFRGPLSSMPEIAKSMKESNEGLTFNWNTKGAGYVDTRSGYRIYALNRTGALPVSYLSGGTNSSAYEKTAYGWFAQQTRNPNLARVVQYAALYQIFHEFRVYTGTSKPIASRQPRPTAITNALAAALQSIRQQECDPQLLASHGNKELEYRRLMHLLGVGDLEHSCDELNALFTEYGAPGLTAVADVMSAAEQSSSDTSLLESVLDRPPNQRDSFVDAMQPEKRMRVEAVFSALELASDKALRHEIARRIPLDKARQWFIAAAERPEGGWIRTASVVVSHPTGELSDLVGGHNLYAEVGRFSADDAVKPGEFRVVHEGSARVVHYSPADSAHLPDWLHAAAVDKSDTELINSMKATLRVPAEVPQNRPLATALAFDDGKRISRGLDETLAGRTGTPGLGWGNPASVSPREAQFLGQVRNAPAPLLRVERLDTGHYRVLIGQSNQVYEARSMTDVVDSVASSLKHAPSPPPTSLMLAGFDDAGAVNLRRSVELRLQGDGVSNPSVRPIRLKADADPDSIFRPILKEGDLTRARFAEWSVKDTVLPSGRSGKVFETTIEVPPKVGGFQGFLLSIRVFFESLFPGLTRLTGAQDSLLVSLSKLPADARIEDAAVAVERELRVHFPNLAHVVVETKDATVAQVRRPANESAE